MSVSRIVIDDSEVISSVDDSILKDVTPQPRTAVSISERSPTKSSPDRPEIPLFSEREGYEHVVNSKEGFERRTKGPKGGASLQDFAKTLMVEIKFLNLKETVEKLRKQKIDPKQYICDYLNDEDLRLFQAEANASRHLEREKNHEVRLRRYMADLVTKMYPIDEQFDQYEEYSFEVPKSHKRANHTTSKQLFRKGDQLALKSLSVIQVTKDFNETNMLFLSKAKKRIMLLQDGYMYMLESKEKGYGTVKSIAKLSNLYKIFLDPEIRVVKLVFAIREESPFNEEADLTSNAVKVYKIEDRYEMFLAKLKFELLFCNSLVHFSHGSSLPEVSPPAPRNPIA